MYTDYGETSLLLADGHELKRIERSVINVSTKPTILFVDDEEPVLKALQRLFQHEDCELLIAASAHRGLEILETSPVQVVISDFRMPNMNGAEFLCIVAERWPDTIRIVLSGYADISSLIATINEGAIYKFICKPWKNKDLLETVWTAVEKHRTQTTMRTLAEEALKQNEILFSQHLDSVQSLTQRNHELEKLVEDLIVFENAFAVMPIPALLFNDHEIEHMNAAAQEILDMRSEEEECKTRRRQLEKDILALTGDLPSMTGNETTAVIKIEGKGTYRITGASLERHSSQMRTVVLLHSPSDHNAEPTSA